MEHIYVLIDAGRSFRPSERRLIRPETAPYTAGNGALKDRKRRFTALIFTLFHRNPSVRITTAVSDRLNAVLLDLGMSPNEILLTQQLY